MVPALLILTGKNLGVSSSFRHIGSMCAPRSKLPYLKNNDWRKNSWNLIFVLGIFLGGVIAAQLLSESQPVLFPESYYTLRGVITVVIGGVLVGFGARYAGGCTSGHTIMGLSNLKWPSLVATLCFFAGGVVTTNFILTLF
jgi:uncharacterized membrane protein YedE/YeeE